ncbi:GIY-YIG nuclease family protein [Pedobacter endophyticus]|nr:GIY-YIG nuclease family protein [Pedobacter endophyticus]
MFYTYILHSKTRNRYYIGYTSNLGERLIRHNQKGKSFTGNTNDWELVYTESYETKLLARNRELQIKSWKSRTKLEELILKKG